MSTVRYYRWDDAGAPSLTGQVGSLTNLLRKCLVGTAGVAYGSKPSAGWTEEFVGAASNIAAFKNSLSDGGSECVILVNDNASSAVGAREASINAYAAMTNISTGVGGLNDVWFRKSGTLDSTARKWLVIADARTVWIYGWDNGNSGGAEYGRSVAGFGDFASVSANYPYFCMGRFAANSTYGGELEALRIDGSTGKSGLWLNDPAGITGPIACSLYPPIPASGTSGIGGKGFLPYPGEAGITFLQERPIIYSVNRYFGNMRGLRLPYFDLRAVSSGPGGALEGDTRNVLAVVTSVNGISDYIASVTIDAQGPWS